MTMMRENCVHEELKRQPNDMKIENWKSYENSIYSNIFEEFNSSLKQEKRWKCTFHRLWNSISSKYVSLSGGYLRPDCADKLRVWHSTCETDTDSEKNKKKQEENRKRNSLRHYLCNEIVGGVEDDGNLLMTIMAFVESGESRLAFDIKHARTPKLPKTPEKHFKWIIDVVENVQAKVETGRRGKWWRRCLNNLIFLFPLINLMEQHSAGSGKSYIRWCWGEAKYEHWRLQAIFNVNSKSSLCTARLLIFSSGLRGP